MQKSTSPFRNISCLSYQFQKNIDSFVRGVQSSLCTVGFSSEEDWIDFFSTAGSLKYKESPIYKSGNRYWEYTISGFLPGIDPNNDQELENLSNSYLILKVEFPSSNPIIVGSKTIGVKFSAPLSIENQGTGFTFSFNCLMNQRAAWLQPLI